MVPITGRASSFLVFLEFSSKNNREEGRQNNRPIQGFIQDFQFGGGDVVCGLTGMSEYFSQVTPRNGAKSIVVSFC